MMHVGLPKWFKVLTYCDYFHRAVLVVCPLPEHARKGKVIPIIYKREVDSFRSVECPVESIPRT